MLKFEDIKDIKISEAALNNVTLVSMMFIELEYMRHVNGINDNMDMELFKKMPNPKEIKQLPSFTIRDIYQDMSMANAGSYPVSMLDSTQKARLTYFIQEMKYSKVMEIAEITVNIWKDLFNYKE